MKKLLLVALICTIMSLVNAFDRRSFAGAATRTQAAIAPEAAHVPIAEESGWDKFLRELGNA